MALFKVFKGASGALNNQTKVDGYCWFTYDDGKFYIDYENPTTHVVERQVLNAEHAEQLNHDWKIKLNHNTTETIYNGSDTTNLGTIYAPTSSGTLNHILVSGGSNSAPSWKATANGAAYATGADGELTFGTLPIAQGGTGTATNPNLSGLIYANSSNGTYFYSSTTSGTSGQILKSNGSGSTPGWYDTTAATFMTIDTVLSASSENLITNKAIATALNSYIPNAIKGEPSGVATLDTYSKITPSQASARVIAIASTTTLSSTHYNCLLRVIGSRTITIPAGLENGTEIEIMNYGTGTVRITPGSGVTLNGGSTTKQLTEQYTSAVLKCVDSDTWVIQGAIS